MHLLLCGHGYLGQAISREFLAAGWDVTALSRNAVVPAASDSGCGIPGLHSPGDGGLPQASPNLHELTCDLTPGQQWWPLGVVRSSSWAASPQWEQARASPLMVGPHVGCSLQYNSLWRDEARNKTWMAVWNVDFAKGCSWWHQYALEWAPTALPMPWPQCGASAAA